MIQLDKMGCMQLDLYTNPNDPRRARWYSCWTSHNGFEKLDTIRGTEAEMDKLVKVLAEMKNPSADLLEKPALREFELVVREPIPSVAMTVVRFKRTALPDRPVRVEGQDGVYMEFIPYIDAYISFRNSSEVDSVMTLFAFHAYDETGKESLSGTAQKEYWRNANPVVNMLADAEPMNFMEIHRDIKLIYLAIQKAMYDKPVIFTESTGEARAKTVSTSSKKKTKRSTVKVRKTIQLNQEELKKYAEPHSHMACPCWGVVGHWRNYKNGKQVWIAPYRKGRERNNPDAYCPKDYQMEEPTWN